MILHNSKECVSRTVSYHVLCQGVFSRRVDNRDPGGKSFLPTSVYR